MTLYTIVDAVSITKDETSTNKKRGIISNDCFNFNSLSSNLIQIIENNDEYSLKFDDKLNQCRINNKFLLLIYNIKLSDYYDILVKMNYSNKIKDI